ncbi:MAG: lamin tail domain-containing protein, partial [Moraxellaceae bacterium]
NTTFTAYLSDASGSFGSPVNIGSTTVSGSDPSGSINLSIPGNTPSGTGYRVRVDATSPSVTGSLSSAFEIINGAKNVTAFSAVPGNALAVASWSNPSSCFDEVLIIAKAGSSISGTPTGDGSAYTASAVFGSGTAFDGGFAVYKGSTSPQTITNLVNGTMYYLKVFSRRGTNWSAGVEITVTPNLQPNAGDIVINQLSPDYNGASNEYVELVNKTTNAYDLSGLALRYQSAGGSGSTLGNLTGTLPGKRFWLLSPDATITVGQTTGIQRDGSFSAGMAAGGGQIALVRISDGLIIDAVGYGTITGGTYTETAAASAPPADGGLKRISDGTDTDNNSADFTTVTNAEIFLRNSLSTPLPIRFTNIKAIQKGTGIEVSWSNATEENVINYAIERSVDGLNFSQAGTLAARLNNNNRADYSFVDVAPNTGDNFYRIKAVENTGKVVYSAVVRINLAKKGAGLNVYPNPVRGNEFT